MAPTAPIQLTMTRRFNAPPAAVFDAWTNPEVLRRWFAAGPDAECAEAVVDLRPGGAYRLAMKVPTGDVYVCIGEYVEIDRPKRLVFTWRWEGMPAEGDGVGGSTVALDFARKRGLGDLTSGRPQLSAWAHRMARLPALQATP